MILGNPYLTSNDKIVLLPLVLVDSSDLRLRSVSVQSLHRIATRNTRLTREELNVYDNLSLKLDLLNTDALTSFLMNAFPD